MNILIISFYNYFVRKKSLNNIPYKKFSLNDKQHCLLNKVLTMSLYCKDIVEPYYMKDVQKRPFTDVLQNRCS